MHIRVRRSIFMCATVLSLAACGSDSGNGPSDDPIVGSWGLSTVGGFSLPVQVTYTGGVVFIINSASALAADGGAFNATYNGTVNSVAAAVVITGTWAKNGSTYVIAGTGALNGVTIGPTNSTATISGNVLTLSGTPAERWVRQ